MCIDVHRYIMECHGITIHGTHGQRFTTSGEDAALELPLREHPGAAVGIQDQNFERW